MSISINRAVRTSWLIICGIVLLSILLMILIFAIGNVYHIPLYVTIPAGIIVFFSVMAVCFQFAAISWLAWSYTNVTDVYELEKAAQVSGFGYYSIEHNLKTKNPKKYKIIAARFKEYVFEDDPLIPMETVIYNRRPFQDYTFILFICLSALGIILVLINNHTNFTPLLFTLVFGVAATYQYYRISDKSPQIIINEMGIQVNEKLSRWQEIKNQEVLQGKTSYLKYEDNEGQNEIELDKLNISKVGLIHLLNVYCQRHKGK